MARLGVSLLAAGQNTGVATPEPRKGACHEFRNDHREGRGGDEHLMTRTAFALAQYWLFGHKEANTNFN